MLFHFITTVLQLKKSKNVVQARLPILSHKGPFLRHSKQVFLTRSCVLAVLPYGIPLNVVNRGANNSAPMLPFRCVY